MADAADRPDAKLPSPREIMLADGTPIVVRPILPEDKERLREGFAWLSRASRYRRFMTPLERLSDAQVRDLTEIDYVNHMAWVALDPAQPARQGLGVARYIRLPDDPTTAEAAVTVIDEHQGRGIGTILLELLAASAREHGIERFRAWVLAENVPMMEMLRGLGVTVVREGSLLRVDVPIPASPEDLPDTPTGRVFKAVAERALPPFQLRDPGTPGQPASSSPA
jgi:GNAT superfamily N-acetyltransferase